MIQTIEEAKRAADQIALLEDELRGMDPDSRRYSDIIGELALLDGYLKDWDTREHG